MSTPNHLQSMLYELEILSFWPGEIMEVISSWVRVITG